MTNRHLARTLDAVANQRQVVAGTTPARVQLVCRVDPALNARVRAHAARAGQTLSTFLTHALALALARATPAR
jgi:predicted HicB family RNase H-like nuclease